MTYFFEYSYIINNIESVIHSILHIAHFFWFFFTCLGFTAVVIGGSIVFLSGRGQRIFDNLHKVITGGAAITVIYKFASGGGGSGDDDKNNKDKNKFKDDKKKSNEKSKSNDNNKSCDNYKSKDKK